MRTRSAPSGVCCVLSVLLLAGCVMALECFATPVLTEKAVLPQAVRADGPLPDDSSQLEKNQTAADQPTLPAWLKAGDIGFDNPAPGRPEGVDGAPAYWLTPELPEFDDEAARRANPMLVGFSRGTGDNPAGTPFGRQRPGSVSGFGFTGMGNAHSQGMFSEAVDGFLKLARDSIFDEGDTAYFSFAGIELSVTLRGDRRSLILNGYDLLPVLLTTHSDAPSQEDAQNLQSATGSTPVAIVQAYKTVDEKLTLTKLREFVTDPTTIGVTGLLVFLWLIGIAVVTIRNKHRW